VAETEHIPNPLPYNIFFFFFSPLLLHHSLPLNHQGQLHLWLARVVRGSQPDLESSPRWLQQWHRLSPLQNPSLPSLRPRKAESNPDKDFFVQTIINKIQPPDQTLCPRLCQQKEHQSIATASSITRTEAARKVRCKHRCSSSFVPNPTPTNPLAAPESNVQRQTSKTSSPATACCCSALLPTTPVRSRRRDSRHPPPP
jgi:hypothetical protein